MRPWPTAFVHRDYASVFYRRGHIETWGRGTLKIARLMQEAGLQPPTLKVNAGFVTLTFVLPASLAPRTQGVGSEKTPSLILRLLIEAPGASIPELAQQLGKSESAVERAIRKLRADGRLVRIGPAKGGHWQVLE